MRGARAKAIRREVAALYAALAEDVRKATTSRGGGIERRRVATRRRMYRQAKRAWRRRARE